MSHEAFFRLFSGLPRYGPGSDDSTRQALRRLSGLPAAPRVLDLGCGSGRQTAAPPREDPVRGLPPPRGRSRELRAALVGGSHHYRPLRGRIAALRAEAEADPALSAAIASTVKEIELYERYGDHYGYVFYLLRAR